MALTALGLVLAHQLAFRLSTRLLNRGVLDPDSLVILKAQLLGVFRSSPSPPCRC
ncbi:MAG: hypothetical protein WCA30_11885 [Dermatophilaceae bacterium]